MQCVKWKSNLKANLPKSKISETSNLTLPIMSKQHWGELLARENPSIGFLCSTRKYMHLFSLF